MLTTHSRTLQALTVRLCRHFAIKRVLPPTAIRTRSPHTPPSPPASLASEPNYPSVLVNPRSLRYPRRNTKMADAYVVPDTDGEEDAELELAIQMSLQQPQPGESSSSSGKRKADLIVISDTESELEEVPPPPSRKVAKAVKDSTANCVYKPQSALRKDKNIVSSAPPSTSSRMETTETNPIPSILGIDRAQMETTETNSIPSIMGIDRAQMERERLGRIRQRKVECLGSITRQKLQNIMPTVVPTELNREADPSRAGAKPAAYNTIINRVECGPFKPDTTKDNIGKSYFAPGIKFPRGVVKKTWAKDVPRDGTDITFEEVLQKETLYGAVLSAFQWDHEWLWTKIPDRKLQRFVLVMQAKEKADKDAILHVLGDLPKTTIVFPPMNKVNCMHSKLMLLFHRKLETGEDWLRIAVPSANLTDYDWGERGNMENSVFIIDLPKLQSPTPDQTTFQKTLTLFCTAKGIPEDVLKRLPEYDFSATAPMAFIPTVGGELFGDIINHVGYTGLGRAITALGYNCGRGLEVDFVTSSLGFTDKNFIMNMYRAAMGSDGIADLVRRAELPRPPTRKQLKKMPKPKKVNPQKQKGMNKKQPLAKDEEDDTDSDVGTEYDEETSWTRVRDLFRLYFPSRDTVVSSVGGIMNAGTICFTPEWWEADTYPRHVMRDCVSVREGLLMHNKMMFVRPPKQLDTPAGKLDAWAYVGSANLSESAWGKLVYDGRKVPKLKCKNWECGVIIPVFAKPERRKTPKRTEPRGIEVFNGVVPVPMQVPSVSIQEEGKHPWYFKEMTNKVSKDRRMRR